jgi:hypothetical protein
MQRGVSDVDRAPMDHRINTEYKFNKCNKYNNHHTELQATLPQLTLTLLTKAL